LICAGALLAWIVCNPFLVACFGPNRSMGEGYNGDDDRTCGGLLFCLRRRRPQPVEAEGQAEAGLEIESLAIVDLKQRLTRFYRDQNPEIKQEINILWPEGAPDSSRTREDKLLWPEGVPDECNWIVRCSMRKRLKDERPDMASVLEFLDAIDNRVENDCYHFVDLDVLSRVGHVRRLNERLRREYGLDLASWAEEQQEQEGAV